MQVPYIIREEVTYRRTAELPDDFDLTDEDALEAALEEDWSENGDPIKDFAAVEDRTVSPDKGYLPTPET